MTDNDRKQDFLDAAQALFDQKGYDRTTINDIIGELDVSKGAFYHYFRSKDDVLAAVAERQIAAEVAITQELVADSSLDAMGKITRLINAVMAHNISTMDDRRRVSTLFEHDGNARLLRKVVEDKIRIIHPAYAAIIRQGIGEDQFTTSFPEEVAEQIINLLLHLNSVVTRLASANNDSLPLAKRKVMACQESIERLLGATPGVISLLPVIDLMEHRQ